MNITFCFDKFSIRNSFGKERHTISYTHYIDSKLSLNNDLSTFLFSVSSVNFINRLSITKDFKYWSNFWS